VLDGELVPHHLSSVFPLAQKRFTAEMCRLLQCAALQKEIQAEFFSYHSCL
jgi:hypothetical protein